MLLKNKIKIKRCIMEINNITIKFSQYAIKTKGNLNNVYLVYYIKNRCKYKYQCKFNHNPISKPIKD